MHSEETAGGGPAAAAAGVRRMPAVDAARGVAMLFACLSHAVDMEARGPGGAARLLHLRIITMIATPSFMLISGMLLGVASTAGEQRFARFREKVLERGILLLTIGHLLILPTHYPTQGARVLFVTDTIAFALIVGPLIVRRTTQWSRVLLAALLLVVSWVVILAVPDGAGGSVAAVLRETLFGFQHQSWWEYSFPLVPWLAVYLVGTVVGQHLADGSSAARPARRLVPWGVGSIAFAAAFMAAARVVRLVAPRSAAVRDIVGQLANPFHKLPPSPVFLLFYGGAALLMTAVVFAWEETGLLPWAFDRAIEIGRASLVVFVVQYYLFYLLMPVLPGSRSALWPLYFVAGMAVLSLLARAWLAAGGNEFLRVPGFRRLRSRRGPPATAAGASLR